MIAPENQRRMAQRLQPKKVVVLKVSHPRWSLHAEEWRLIDEAASS